MRNTPKVLTLFFLSAITKSPWAANFTSLKARTKRRLLFRIVLDKIKESRVVYGKENGVAFMHVAQ
jgi:hypothetical protein